MVVIDFKHQYTFGSINDINLLCIIRVCHTSRVLWLLRGCYSVTILITAVDDVLYGIYFLVKIHVALLSLGYRDRVKCRLHFRLSTSRSLKTLLDILARKPIKIMWALTMSTSLLRFQLSSFVDSII